MAHPVVRGVPVLRPESAEATETWFEAMYQHRSRFVDLESDYLRAERDFIERFARTKPERPVPRGGMRHRLLRRDRAGLRRV